MVKSPWVLPSSAQLPRRHRGGNLLLQARLRRCPLHLARTGPLQSLHLVRRGGAQHGAVRPAQTSLAAPDGKAMQNRQIRPTSTARNAIPQPASATKTRKVHERSAARIAICPVRPCLYRLKAALYGCALASFLARFPSVDENDVAAPLLQMQRDADPDHSRSQYDHIRVDTHPDRLQLAARRRLPDLPTVLC